MENIIIASSNLYALMCVCNSHTMYEFIVLICAMCISIIYHLNEYSHDISKMSVLNDIKLRVIFLNLNRLFSIAIFLIYFDMKYLSWIYANIIATIFIAFFFGATSEILYRNMKSRYLYVFARSMWYIYIYHVVYLMQIHK